MIKVKSAKEGTKNYIEGRLRTIPVPCPRCKRKSQTHTQCPYKKCKAKWNDKEIKWREEQRLCLKKQAISYMILDFLEKQEWPSTTEDVAEAVGVTWHTAQIHLFKLQVKGSIKYRKVGRQNQWWLTEKYRKEFKK